MSLPELADLAEKLRQEGKHAEALKTVECCLEQNPNHPRAILLLGRLLYQGGEPLRALAALRPLDFILGLDEALKTIAASLEQLWRERNSQTDPAFVTETMAGLLVEQGYLLEALEIYRQLLLASGGEKRLWERILSLRERLGQGGSRDAQKEKVIQALEVLDRWIQTQQRED